MSHTAKSFAQIGHALTLVIVVEFDEEDDDEEEEVMSPIHFGQNMWEHDVTNVRPFKDFLQILQLISILNFFNVKMITPQDASSFFFLRHHN